MIKSVLLTAMLICTGMISDNDASIAQDSIRSSIYGPFFSNSTLNKNLTYYLVQQYEESISELQRPVTSDFLEEPRRQVIGEIARQGNLGIAINPDLPLLDVPLTIKLENNTVAEALKLSLAGTNYEAAISRWREIVLVEREEALPGSDLYQQHAIITGRIVDASSGEPLIGANIILQNTAVGTTSNMDGEYSLRGIPAGEQVLEIRYLGYVPLNIPINMIEGEERELLIQLEPDVLEGENVVIYTQVLGQQRAIRQQIASNTIINVVSEARIREIPDANAAESVGRLPGVSIIRDAGEGARVSIRGLGPRFNAVTFDGARVPSTDEDGRALDLNMISSEMLSGIEVFKAITPDMDADAIGGSINFTFAGAPDERRARANLRTGYNNHTQNIGTYNLSISGSDRFFNGLMGVSASADIQRNDRSSDVFGGSYGIHRHAREGERYAPLEVLSVNLTDRMEIRDRIGAGAILDFNIPGGQIFVNSFASRLDRDEFNQRKRYNIDDGRVEISAIDRELQTNVLSSRVGGDHEFGRFEMQWRLGRNVSELTTPRDHVFRFYEHAAFYRELLDITKGPKYVPDAAINELKETLFYSSVYRETRNRELDYEARVDFGYSSRIGTVINSHLKFGGKFVQKDRIRRGDEWQIRHWDYHRISGNENRDWIIGSTGAFSILNYQNPDYYRNDFLDGQYVMNIGLDRDGVRGVLDHHMNQHIRGYGIWLDNQDVIERISAAYAMTQLDVGSRLMILPGIRYEYTNSDYTSRIGAMTGSYNNVGTLTDTTAYQKFGTWFPMVQARYHITDNIDVRIARTETISRPTFMELMPYIEYGRDVVRRGHTDLKPAESINYDLFLSTYGNRIGLFSVGFFHKNIQYLVYYRDVIIMVPERHGLPDRVRGDRLVEPFNNTNETEVYGFEIEWQSNLTYLPSPLNGLVINANFSRIWSETQYPQFYMERTAQGFVPVDTFRVGPMIHQPDYVSNLSIGYDYRGFSARVSMLYQGSTLRAVGDRPETDSYTDDYLRFDASARQRLLQNLDLFLNLHNFTNRRDGATQFTGFFPTSQEYYGWSMDIGVRYNIF